MSQTNSILGPPSRLEKEELLDLLSDARDEKPLQTYLFRHPAFFYRFLPPGKNSKVHDRPKLGAEYIPDFLISVQNSAGSHWACVELESPTALPLTKAGELGSKLNHAIGQLNDWREWLRDNIAYARTQLNLKRVSAEMDAWIVIGRRHSMNENQLKRYSALKRLGVQVMSFDRLIDG